MKKPIRLTKRLDPRSIHNPPNAIALEREEAEMAKRDEDKPLTYEMMEINSNFFDCPFPVSIESQKKLLDLIHTRKSGIITRSELREILYSEIRTIN